MILKKGKMGKWGKISAVSVIALGLFIGLISFDDKDFKISKNLDIFITLFGELNKYYVDGTDPEKLIESGIEGMLNSLDPYTTYIPERNVDDFKFMTTGKYGGIGALIRKAGGYTIISEPYEGFPAQRIGLHAGDTLLTIDGVSTKNKSISQVSELLKGTPNTPLTLKIRRIGVDSVITKTFNREQVAIPNVPYAGLIDNQTGYIVLGNFMRNAGKDVKKAFQDLKKQGATSIILDLRGNPGGLLDEAINVSNIWLPKGLEIVSTKSINTEWDKSYYTKNSPVDTVMPLVVLVNRSSASASEIVAGSLQDLDRAVIIGQKTFGKGLVQSTRPLSYSSLLKVTTAKYYTPSGRCIQALDYTHRNEDGSVGHIPDSLISEFKTRNGRSVFDGGGVDPDLKIHSDDPGKITMALYVQNHIFDFATLFASKTDSIADPRTFTITDDTYDWFKEYLSDKEFTYSTRSKDKLQELIKTAKAEGYYDNIEAELEVMSEHLVGNKQKDLNTFSMEIKELLKDEIVSRYYYQKGRIASGINNDPEVQKALDVLNDQESMFSILNGSYTGETIFAYYTY